MGIRESIEGLIRTYRASLLLPNADAVDPTCGGLADGREGVSAPGRPSGGHNAHGEHGRLLSFDPTDLPVCVEIERDLARLLTVAQRRVEAAQSPSSRSARGDRVSPVAKAEKARILASYGPAIEVAYLSGWTESGVRKARLQNGLDPDTGERVRQERPITARAPR